MLRLCWLLGNFGRFRKIRFGGGALLVAWVYGFDCWRYGFGVWFFALEIDYGEEHKEQEHV